tara:strand:- start:1884 stop:2150 length:267 start_codon:yes stop_codon:yes gene_type:complete
LDNVKRPGHYAQKIECWDAMEAMMDSTERVPRLRVGWYMAFLWGNTFKYLWRWPFKKEPLEDLKKAQVYLERLISRVEKLERLKEKGL